MHIHICNHSEDSNSFFPTVEKKQLTGAEKRLIKTTTQPYRLKPYYKLLNEM